jgi:hypothetical protein
MGRQAGDQARLLLFSYPRDFIPATHLWRRITKYVALSSAKLLIVFRVEYTKAGNLTMNAASGSHDDMVEALALAWFGVLHCAGSLGPPREVVW